MYDLWLHFHSLIYIALILTLIYDAFPSDEIDWRMNTCVLLCEIEVGNFEYE